MQRRELLLVMELAEGGTLAAAIHQGGLTWDHGCGAAVGARRAVCCCGRHLTAPAAEPASRARAQGAGGRGRRGAGSGLPPLPAHPAPGHQELGAFSFLLCFFLSVAASTSCTWTSRARCVLPGRAGGAGRGRSPPPQRRHPRRAGPPLQNVLLTAAGRVKLADVGLSKHTGQASYLPSNCNCELRSRAAHRGTAPGSCPPRSALRPPALVACLQGGAPWSTLHQRCCCRRGPLRRQTSSHLGCCCWRSARVGRALPPHLIAVPAAAAAACPHEAQPAQCACTLPALPCLALQACHPGGPCSTQHR